MNLKGKGNFSDDALNWIDDVRKCLLVKLVPVIRPYANMNCTQMIKFAAENQQQCYSEPYYGRPTICDLDFRNWAKVFWFMAEEFDNANSVFLKDIIAARYQCVFINKHTVMGSVFDNNGPLTNSDIGMVRLTVEVAGNTSKTTSYIQVNIPDSVTTQLAEQLHWNQRGVMWFSFLSNDSEADEFCINILLGLRSVYDIKAIDFPKVKMSDVITDMAVALATGSIFLHDNDGLNVTKFYACLDFGCKGTYYSITPVWRASTGFAILPKLFETIFTSHFMVYCQQPY